MHGVRRFLAGAAAPAQPPPTPEQASPDISAPLPPLKSLSGPSWPPPSPSFNPSPVLPPTTPLVIGKKDRSGQRSVDETISVRTSAGASKSPGLTRIQLGAAFSTPSHQTRPSVSSVLSASTGSNRSHSPGSTTSSPRMLNSRSVITRKTVPAVDPAVVDSTSSSPVNSADNPKRASSSTLLAMNTRDELLISLLASQAVVDSREFEILGSEEVEELKKEEQLLSSRLVAATKKLALETKIRDAAVHLTKLNSSSSNKKRSDEQLEAANNRVDQAQRELWKVSERANEVRRRLLEHRAGVLSLSVRSLESKISGVNGNGSSEDSGYDSSNRSTLQSPVTSVLSSTASVTSNSSAPKVRFDGAHLFAGHANAIVPRRKMTPEQAAAEVTSLEAKLKAATETLSLAGKKQAELSRELSLMKLEKQEVETMMGFELQSTEERLGGFEEQVQKLEWEKTEWEKERKELVEQQEKVTEDLRSKLRVLEAEQQDSGKRSSADAKTLDMMRAMLDEKDDELRGMKALFEEERERWDMEKAEMEDAKMDGLAKLQEEMIRSREEDSKRLTEMNEELESGLSSLQALVKEHGVVLFSRDSSLKGLLGSVGTHLSSVHSKLATHSQAEAEWENVRRKLEEDVRMGLDKRESLVRELEGARRERDEGRSQAKALEARLKDRDSKAVASSTPKTAVLELFNSSDESVAKIIAILQPIWAILPSPEARAARFSNSRSFRPGTTTAPASPTMSPSPLGGTGSASGQATSLSELDVRSLKSLYDWTRNGAPPMSPSPQSGFTIEAFAARVQALIADDRALIERLIRFAQAHDLLKKNAERAQKLAQDGNVALETYQKQVRTLEERNMSFASKQAAIQEELQLLQDTLERVEKERREMEMMAAEQAETCRQLTEANNTLSARTLTLAEEAAAAPEMVRKQLEAQLAECRAALEAAQDELDAMRTSEQSQRIALLDELNSMQTENGALRAQLRARDRVK